MNNVTTIATLVRALVNDEEQTGTDVFVYTTSSIFTLTEKNVNSVSDVSVNGVSSGVTYTVSLATSKISVTSDLTTEDVIEVTYAYNSNYSDNELIAYIKSALTHLSINNLTTYMIDDITIYPEPADKEANLIGLIASILINPENISYRMPDISVAVPKDLNTLDKIRKVIAIYKKDSSGFMFVAEDYPGGGSIFDR